MFFTIGSLHILLLFPVLSQAGPWCFKCDDAFHPAVCKEVIACGDHESCYANKHTTNNGAIVYSSGCKPTADCVGPIKRAAVVSCEECCNGTACNEVSCSAQEFSVNNRLWCSSCKYQADPKDCDQAELCSQDEQCSVAEQTTFGQKVYNLGCLSTASCAGKTLAADKMQCCDSHLCNSNKAAVSPDVYTPPPPTTTTPPPAAATADVANKTVDYVSKSQPNETIQLVCNIGGFPVPNVTWIFTPDPASAAGNSSAGATPTGSASTINSTAGNNTTTTGNGTAGSTSRVTTMEITAGVTTTAHMSILEITAPEDKDSGVYTCKVENGLGAADSSSTVSVKRAPVIAGQLNETVQGEARDDVILDCDVDGTLPIEITWLSPPNAGGIEQLANGSLLIHNAHADNNGDYLCLAKNSVGNEGKTVHLTINDNSSAACPTPPTSTVSPLMSPPTTARTTTPLPTTTATTPTTTTTIGATTTPADASTTPCVCPYVASTATTPTTPPTTTATTSTTPPTTSTAPATTTTAATTTTPTSSASTTTPTSPSVSTAATPIAIGAIFQNVEEGTAVLQCAAGPGTTIEWSRMEADFDHSLKEVFRDNGYGVLVVTPRPRTMLESGVYECHVPGAPANDTARFVIYKLLPAADGCNAELDFRSTPSPGIVFRMQCPSNCTRSPTKMAPLDGNDKVCESALDRQVIPSSGGWVTWLIKANNMVALLNVENGRVNLVT